VWINGTLRLNIIAVTCSTDTSREVTLTLDKVLAPGTSVRVDSYATVYDVDGSPVEPRSRTATVPTP
jgi:hypothetical protein